MIEAASAVVATNSPINDRFQLHTKMSPYRTYAMAFTLPRGDLPDALFWDTGDPYHYVRMNPGPGSVDYLIAGGADHKSGEADDGDIRFEAIEAWIRALVPTLGKEVTRWSGQVLDTIDYCAFIGLNPGSKSVYVVTGDSGQGMTHGALSGLLLKDLIAGKENPWAAVYEPSRKTPSGVINYVRENLSVVKNLAGYVLPGELKSVDELAPGQGGILRDGLRKIAACRDLDGKLHLHSATCTHSGCEVAWNSTEQCWDCSCHGSHFAPDGTVLERASGASPGAGRRCGSKADVMPIVESGKKIVEKITGWQRPSSDDLDRLVRSRKANIFHFNDDGLVPNHPHWDMIVYRGAVKLPEQFDPAAIFEDIFERNGWGSSWRNGIYNYVHYHSRIHEVLGVARGSGKVQFGGTAGPHIDPEGRRRRCAARRHRP